MGLLNKLKELLEPLLFLNSLTIFLFPVITGIEEATSIPGENIVNINIAAWTQHTYISLTHRHDDSEKRKMKELGNFWSVAVSGVVNQVGLELGVASQAGLNNEGGEKIWGLGMV